MSTEAKINSNLPVKAEEITALTVTAPEALTLNQTSLTNAKRAAETLIAVAKEKGMSSELDTQMNEYQIKLRKTLALINDRRKPITQTLDAIKKAFTEIESEAKGLDVEIQAFRNEYAKHVAELARKAEDERLAKIQLERERSEYISLVEQQAFRHFNTYLSSMLQFIVNEFETCTLENIDILPGRFETLSEEYPVTHFSALANTILPAMTLTGEEKLTIYRDVMNAKLPEYKAQFTNDVREQKQWVIERIPGKKLELQRIAEAKGAEAERLKKEAEERQARERERLEAEKREAEEKQRREAEAQKEASNIQALFDAAAAAPDTSQVKEGYKIVVNNPAAYLLIAQYWFEREGISKPVETIEKTTFLQMKTFAEKRASKDDKEQIKSPFITYEPVYSAKIKRATK